ncbi:MAG: transcriptional repressor [Emcibacteraceae bacterium]|nr:transcriptional repressor [Emcibacteraceae bacterium]
MTEPRRVILGILMRAKDHPTADDIYRRAREEYKAISVATVYRTINLLEAAGIIEGCLFQSNCVHYEVTNAQPHDHLIDLDTSRVVEFRYEIFDQLKENIAKDLGYRMADCRVEIYAHSLKNKVTE